MTVNVIAYAPGGGGNHLRNLVALDGRFEDQWPWDWVREKYLGNQVYSPRTQPQGTAHAIPGRNLHGVFVDHIRENPGRDYVIHGHFGELALHRDKLCDLDTRFLLITLDDAESRRLLTQRQNRLAQRSHPYWIEEEQLYLYQPLMYQQYFNAKHTHTIPLSDFWHRDLAQHSIVQQISGFFQVTIDHEQAQQLHNIWCDLNFGTAK
jgi:hypothetical protein